MDDDSNQPLKYNGFLNDDALLLRNILTENWDTSKLPKIIFYWDEDNDISQFDFRTGEVPVKIYANDIYSEPRGISFDSVAESRVMVLNIRSTDRETLIKVADEIRRILYLYRLRPGNDYDVMYMSQYTPIYPSYKFYNMNMMITLRKYMFMLPYVDSSGNH